MGCEIFTCVVEQPQVLVAPVTAARYPWLRDLAVKMRADGVPCKKIAATLGITSNQVCRLTGTFGNGPKKVSAECNMTEPWKPRKIRRVYNREAVMTNAILFAKGKINRDTFLRRIT